MIFMTRKGRGRELANACSSIQHFLDAGSRHIITHFTDEISPAVFVRHAWGPSRCFPQIDRYVQRTVSSTLP